MLPTENTIGEEQEKSLHVLGCTAKKIKGPSSLACQGLLIPGLVVQDNAIGAKGLGFDSRADQSRHSVANGSPPLRRFFVAIVAQALSRGVGPATRHTLRRWQRQRVPQKLDLVVKK